MSSTLVINNTRNFHHGSAEVMNFFRRELDADFSKTLKLPKRLTHDVVIANGEGNMHDNGERAQKVLNYLRYAKRYGAYTMLVNSVWQNQDTSMLEYVDYISVREVMSRDEIYNSTGRTPEIHLDLSYFTPVSRHNKPRTLQMTTGNLMGPSKIKPKVPPIGDSTIDVFTQSWQEMIDTLSQSKLLITGRHHEMYAACVARCPFIVLEGNTHKNQGLIKMSGADIPCLPMDSTIQEVLRVKVDQYEYDRLFDFMEKQEKPDYARMVR